MSYDFHQTFDVNLKKGLQGFQFNYPIEGAIFDKTRQRVLLTTAKVNDGELKELFARATMFGSAHLGDKWLDANDLLKENK